MRAKFGPESQRASIAGSSTIAAMDGYGLASVTPILLDQNPDAVMSRNMLKNATPWLISGRAFLGQAMSSTRGVCSLGVAATNVLPNRSEHSLSSQASPPRIGV